VFQGFANVAARADCSRHRRSQGEEGAGLPLQNGSHASRSGWKDNFCEALSRVQAFPSWQDSNNDIW